MQTEKIQERKNKEQNGNKCCSETKVVELEEVGSSS